MKYNKLSDLVRAAQGGELDDSTVVRIDNDVVFAYEDNPDDPEDPTLIYQSEYGPWCVLEELLRDLGIKAGSV